MCECSDGYYIPEKRICIGKLLLLDITKRTKQNILENKKIFRSNFLLKDINAILMSDKGSKNDNKVETCDKVVP